MRTHSPFVIDVRELLEAPGTRRALTLSAPVAGLAAGGGTGLVGVEGDVGLDLVAEAIEGGLFVSGALRGSYAGSCRRCLSPLQIPFEVEVAEVFRPASGEWEEGYVLKEGSVDLERMVIDAVGLEMPANPLCRPDCAGLCPRCGADRNAQGCDCAPEPADLRWSALQQLRGPASDQTR